MLSLSLLSQATSSSRWNQKPISLWAVSTESLAWTTFLRGDSDGDSDGDRAAAVRCRPPQPYLVMCTLRSPRMVPTALLSPTMARVHRTTL